MNKTKEKLFRLQQDLETVQRAEEDRLMETFHRVRKQHALSIQKEMDSEWETQLKQLTDKYIKKTNKRDKAVSAASVSWSRIELIFSTFFIM